MTWERGRAEIEHLLASGDLEQIHGPRRKEQPCWHPPKGWSPRPIAS